VGASSSACTDRDGASVPVRAHDCRAVVPRGTAKISTKPAVGRPRRASRPSPVLAAGSGRQRDRLFSEAVDQVFRPKASGSHEVRAGLASENESSLKLWTTHVRVPPLDSQAPPLTRGNASYCGFQAYLGRTPRNHSDEDTDLDGRDHLADRLSDEVDWLRQCAGWLRQLDGGGYPAGGDEGPSAGWPDRAAVAAGLARVAAVIDRIAADVDELARAWRAGDLDTAAVLPGRRAERRRRLAEPDLEFRAFCARTGLPASSTPQPERAWDAWQAERYRRGETGQRPGYTGNPFRPR